MSLVLPALRGADPLGYLAALGLLSLSEQGAIPELGLAWSEGATPIPLVSGEIKTVDQLADSLHAAVERLALEHAALPGVPSDLPRPKTGSGPDPMRMARADLQGLYEEVDQRWTEGDRWSGRWLVALAGHSSDDKDGRVLLTPFYAPTGQMSLRASIFEGPREAVRRIGGPGDALTSWRRVPFDGANFDERAIRDGAATTGGGPANQGVPSATWLAAMAIRLFPIVDDGRGIRTTSWLDVRMYPGYTRRSLVWPIWSESLDPPAVRALLAHPLLPRAARALLAGTGGQRLERQLRALGVARLYGSSRATRQQGDGPLGPARLLWSVE